MQAATPQVLSYRILLRAEPEGGYTVTVPTLPGCITFGDTITEAIAMAREAIELYLESLHYASPASTTKARPGGPRPAARGCVIQETV